jgi:hypothetical protein
VSVVIGVIKMESRLNRGSFLNGAILNNKQAKHRLLELSDRGNQRSEASDDEMKQLINVISKDSENKMIVKRGQGGKDGTATYMVQMKEERGFFDQILGLCSMENYEEVGEGRPPYEMRSHKDIAAVGNLNHTEDKKPEELGLVKYTSNTYRTRKGASIEIPADTYYYKGHPKFMANAWVNRFGELNYVWRSVEPVTSEEGIALIKRLLKDHENASVHVNTGGHGGIGKDNNPMNYQKHGDVSFTEKERAMVKKELKENKVSFLDVSAYSEPIAPTNANHIVLLWCYSMSNTESLIGTKEPNVKRRDSAGMGKCQYLIPKKNMDGSGENRVVESKEEAEARKRQEKEQDKLKQKEEEIKKLQSELEKAKRKQNGGGNGAGSPVEQGRANNSNTQNNTNNINQSGGPDSLSGTDSDSDMTDYESEIKRLMGGRFMGVGEWKKLNVEVNDAPKISKEMFEFLTSVCPISGGGKVHETHQVLLLAKGVRASDMEELTKGKREGHGKLHGSYIDKMPTESWNRSGSEKSEWSVMYVGDMEKDNGIIPNSKREDWDKQQEEVEKYKKKGYGIVTAREVIMHTLMRYVETGEKILSCNIREVAYMYTRTIDTWSQSSCHVYVGGFYKYGLLVYLNDNNAFASNGVAVSRNCF